MMESADRRIIRHLEEAFAIADQIGDHDTGFPIERALDQVQPPEL